MSSAGHRNLARQRMLQKLGLTRRLSAGDTTDDEVTRDIPNTTDDDDESEYVSELDQAMTTADEYDAANSTDDYMTYSAIFNQLRNANLIKPQSSGNSLTNAYAVTKRNASVRK